MASEILVADFAQRDPERFALVLAQGSFEELLAVLDTVPRSTAAAVAGRLPADAFDRLASDRFDTLCAWLNSASFDDAVVLLGRVSRARAIELVDRVEHDRLQRKLRQFMNFPEHCVGAIVKSVVVQVREDTPVAEVLSELRGAGGSEEIPAVVLNASGRLAGRLDLWKLLLTEAPLGTAGDFVAPVPVLHPETSIASAVELEYWNEHQWLPVVDGDHRVLGAALREQVLVAAVERQSGGNLLGDAITDVCHQFLGVAGDILSRFLGNRSWS